jgi:hypothetical protein
MWTGFCIGPGFCRCPVFVWGLVFVAWFLWPGFCGPVFVARFLWPGFCGPVFVARFLWPGFCQDLVFVTTRFLHARFLLIIKLTE